MGGYWNNPFATSNAFLDGWLMTGHMGSIDQDGYITLKDRSKDMIISGGTNIYPREVEEALITHRIVDEVSVGGRQHPDWGEEVVA
jgi:long-chain acyl-CoA synthetase